MSPLKLMTAACALVVVTTGPLPAQQSYEKLVAEGNRLAAVLRAGRSVVSNNQDLINDPDKAEKGLTSSVFMKAVEAAFVEQNGTMPVTDDLPESQRLAIEAQLSAMSDVVDKNQELINKKGMAFKGFIPAVFARLVNERFGEKMGAAAKIKVTAPSELIRNRKARPDDWEAAVINDKFRKPDWPKGQAFFETATVKGAPAFRMLIPEYYSASCLSCHGSPKGEVDVTGFPKEGGTEGSLAGAISITLFQ